MPNRPDIILIITDQQRYDTIRELVYPYMDTPDLDHLVHGWIEFVRPGWVPQASCSLECLADLMLVSRDRETQFVQVGP